MFGCFKQTLSDTCMCHQSTESGPDGTRISQVTHSPHIPSTPPSNDSREIKSRRALRGDSGAFDSIPVSMIKSNQILKVVHTRQQRRFRVQTPSLQLDGKRPEAEVVSVSSGQCPASCCLICHAVGLGCSSTVVDTISNISPHIPKPHQNLLPDSRFQNE